MANDEVTTGEIMEFLKEHMPTKAEFLKLESEVYDIRQDLKQNYVTKDDLHAVENRVVTHIDRFAKLHETLDTELVSLRGKYDRLEGRLEIVEAKLGLAGA